MNRVSQDRGYGRLKEQLIASTGLAYYADRDEILTGVIGGRISDLGLRGCSAYAGFLADGEKGSAEMEILIAQLTNGETYFFRGEEQFAAIRDVILPDILERKQSSRELHIWSAGCASGAEPYSLAIMLMDEFADRIAGWQVGIHATDINRSDLARAAEGKFRAWALRSTSDAVRLECFSRAGPVWTIHPRYKLPISFHHMNLVDGEFATPWLAGMRFDLILCRNVMIYFAPAVNLRLVGRFHESLEDGGWLVVGPSEGNPMNYRAFRCVSTAGATLYQKMAPPGGQTEEAPEPAAAPQPPIPALCKPGAQSNRADLQGLRQLADRGDWQDAADYGRRLLAEDRLNPAIHFYRALIFEKLGVADEPERSLRQAIYLDRKFALAHYHLGLALQRGRQPDAAARSFGNVLKVLSGAPEQEIVTAGPGVTAAALKDLAKMHLEELSGS